MKPQPHPQSSHRHGTGKQGIQHQRPYTIVKRGWATPGQEKESQNSGDRTFRKEHQPHTTSRSRHQPLDHQQNLPTWLGQKWGRTAMPGKDCQRQQAARPRDQGRRKNLTRVTTGNPGSPGITSCMPWTTLCAPWATWTQKAMGGQTDATSNLPYTTEDQQQAKTSAGHHMQSLKTTDDR